MRNEMAITMAVLALVLSLSAQPRTRTTFAVVQVVQARRDGDALIAVVHVTGSDPDKPGASAVLHDKTFTLSCAAITAKSCDAPLKVGEIYPVDIFVDNTDSLSQWDIIHYDNKPVNGRFPATIIGRYFLKDRSLEFSLTRALRPIEVLSVNRERPNPMSSAFMPVLMVRNNSAEDREISVRWYATDGGTTVGQGSCYTVGPLLAQSTTRVTCGPMVLGYPNATIKLGTIDQRPRN